MPSFCEVNMKHFDPTKYDMSYSEYVNLIDEWIFSEIDRIILKRKLLDGMTFEKVAEELQLSVTQTKEHLYKAEKILFKQIEKRNPS